MMVILWMAMAVISIAEEKEATPAQKVTAALFVGMDLRLVMSRAMTLILSRVMAVRQHAT